MATSSFQVQMTNGSVVCRKDMTLFIEECWKMEDTPWTLTHWCVGTCVGCCTATYSMSDDDTQGNFNAYAENIAVVNRSVTIDFRTTMTNTLPIACNYRFHGYWSCQTDVIPPPFDSYTSIGVWWPGGGGIVDQVIAGSDNRTFSQDFTIAPAASGNVFVQARSVAQCCVVGKFARAVGWWKIIRI